ncbi:glycerol-3-phosphate regulon repressor [Antarctobacter heliothermus]|uniref:Glycerol-3-phosphate regulon repressor n=1 Tax=Antarctobacter heliothermus TaxID=74033 RepID=A0A222DZD3_9RHOB|nr:DeoR/GlpR family DNA-binding transcription regulator [Antarctobacter heliothermus]ASP19262.1 glycerol-3-phosphate regulon repressor [Antarctobacter heliothermus]MBT53928.1 DeoR/GlpR transcriptional regulator [Mameliella sp.]|tara:strand:+ start:3638 stop:4453 length:816 start_codon:yes stop_codon:yes gene_type:complete
MSDTSASEVKKKGSADRIKKSERRRQILLELKLRPHVRISELADRFQVSTETVRRDFGTLADDGLISRAHGGASAPSQGHYPGLDERANALIEERARIGMKAAELVQSGETLMIDSGSTTIQMARSLAYLGTSCTVITNSIPVAMTLGHGAAEVLLCPGEYMAAESALVGTETLEFLRRFHVDHCMIGASGLSEEGPSETVRGFAAVKRVMLRQGARRHLLIDEQKFGRKGLALVGSLDALDTIITDNKPKGDLLSALDLADVHISVADHD